MVFQHALMQSLAGRNDRIAIENGSETISYGQLTGAAQKVTAFLLSRGLEKETIIGVMLEKRPEIITAMIGVANARCVFVLLDPLLPQQRLEAMIRDMNLGYFIYSPAVAAEKRELAGVEGFSLDDILADTNAASFADLLYPAYDAEDSLYIYFTSGTTGTPKGIVGRNGSLLQFLEWELAEFGIDETFRCSQLISPYFDAFLRDVFVPLLAGGRICIAQDEIYAPWIDAARINLVHCVPSVFRVINKDDLTPDRFKDLKYILLSGEKINPVELRNWYQLFGSRIQLVNLYGATETTMIRSFYRIVPEDVNEAKIPIGAPIADTELLILNKDGKPCNTLVVGELYIVSDYLTKGYLNAPELTQQRFVKLNAGTPNERAAFRTGDKARMLGSGKIELLGREDRQIKLRGIRIELDEIESTLAAHPLVRNAAVIVHTDEAGNELLAAFFVRKEEEGIPEDIREELVRHLANTLPKPMLPSLLTGLKEFPLLPNGKINYKAFREHVVSGREITLPANPWEEAVLGIWKEVLGDKPISTDEAFTAAGGNSLTLMSLISGFSRQLNVRLNLSQLFENMTIKKQAALLAGAGSGSLPMIPRAKPAARYVLSSAQKRLYFLNQLDETSTAYNDPEFIWLEGELDRARLHQALQRLTKRHEILRTSIDLYGDEPMQTIESVVTVELELFSNEKDIAAVARRFVRPFDLKKAPLMRVGLLETSVNEHLLLFDVHHIVADGESYGIIIRDFMAFYTGESLPEMKLQYKDFAEWQQQAAQQKAIARQRSFWLDELRGARSLDLPMDRPRPKTPDHKGGIVSFGLGKEEVSRLRALAESEGATLFMVMLSIFKVFLSKISKEKDIVVGYPIAGRHHEGVENMIGMFVNTLPVRSQVDGESSFRQFLRSIKDKIVKCLANQDYPYEEMVDGLQLERNTDRNPLFDILFVFQNYSTTELELPDLHLRSYLREEKESKFDLSLYAEESRKGMDLRFEFLRVLFDGHTIEKWAGYLQRLVSIVVEDADVTIGEMNMEPGISAMDFSLFLSSGGIRPAQDRYSLLLELVQYADGHGFEAIWIPEKDADGAGGIFPNPSAMGAALAMITKKIEFRCGSAAAHSAAGRIVEEWSAIDNLSRGRVALAFNAGEITRIDAVRALWKGERELPAWIVSAENPVDLTNAGKANAHLLLSLRGQEIEEVAAQIKLYREARLLQSYKAKEGKVAVMLPALPLNGSAGNGMPEVQRLKDIGVDEIVWLMDFDAKDEVLRKTIRELYALRKQMSTVDQEVDPLEQQLISLWSGVLKKDADSIDIHSSFFQCGGNSLLAVVLVNKIFKVLNIVVPLRALHEHSSIAALKAYILNVGRPAYTPIGKAVPKAFYALSDAQKAMYFLYLMDKDSLFYNQPWLFRIDGPLDTARLATALNELVRRHEVLRTSVVVIDGEPFQKINDAADLEIEYYCCEEGGFRQLIDVLVRPFDLSRTPLRISLVKETAKIHFLVIDYHHIAVDGTSGVILRNELGALYRGQTLPELQLQYKDYSEWQQSEERNSQIRLQKKFWEQQFAHGFQLPEFPVDHPGPDYENPEGGVTGIVLSLEEEAALKAIAGKADASLFMVLLSVYNIFLAKLSNQEDILLGTVVAGREHPDVDGMLGMFVSAIPLRSRVRGESGFGEFLQEVKGNTLSCFDNQAYFYRLPLTELNIERRAGGQSLYNAFFLYQNFGYAPPAYFDGLSITSYDYGEKGEQRYDIHFVVKELNGRLDLQVACHGKFRRETRERFADNLLHLIREVIAHPDNKIVDLELMAEAEKRRILSDLSAVSKVDRPGETFPVLFARQAAKTPERVAVEHNGIRLTYGELQRKVEDLASILAGRGIRKDSRVALYMSRGIAMLTGMIAVFRCGAIYIPLDTDHPTERLRDILTDCEPEMLLTTGERISTIEELTGGLTSPVAVLNLDKPVLVTPIGIRQAYTGDDLAYLIYTSGTTGRPKGVMIHQAGMTNHLLAKVADLGLGEEDIVAQTASCSFDISIWQFLAALLAGAKTYIVDKSKVLDPGRMIAELRESGITVLESVPSLLSLLLDVAVAGEPVDLPSLRWMIATGESLSVPLAIRWYSVFPGIPLMNAYGPTEASDDVTHYVVDRNIRTAITIPLGKPVRNMQVFILDQRLRLCPPGVRGEICIAGPGVGKGYWKKERETEAVFVANPFAEPDDPHYATLYRTGDLGHYSLGGEVSFDGRMDEQIKIRGSRIEPAEIENVLSRHPAVRDVVVLVHGDEPGDRKLAAFVVSASPFFPVAEVRQFLRDRLPDAMIPSIIAKIDRIPLTANGKTDRKTLLARTDLLEQRGRHHEEPESEWQIALAEIWKEVLGLERVGLKDTFFELGGHSLLLIKNNKKIKDRFDTELPFALFFDHTLEQIAQELSRRQAKEEVEEGVGKSLTSKIVL